MNTRIKRIVPPALLDVARRLTGRPVPRESVSYQGVTTPHNMRDLHHGRFASCYDRFASLDPHMPSDTMRLRTYFACLFASMTRHVPGDFLFGGISYGVLARVVYEFVGAEESRCRTFYLIDPFQGVDASGAARAGYNTDPDLVRRQYPKDGVQLRREFIPDCFPLAGLERLAFAHLNTGVVPAEVASLPYLYERLSPGGILLVDSYAIYAKDPACYDTGLPGFFTLPTGQGVLQKTD